MTVTALEVSLNGQVLYTVGMEGWHSLGASIHGLRFSAEALARVAAQLDDISVERQGDEVESLSFSAYVGLPDPDGSGSSSGAGIRTGKAVSW